MLAKLLCDSGFFVLKKKKFKEKEKSAWEPMKKLSIRWIFSFFVKGDDDLSKRNVEHNQKHVKTS